MHRTEAPTALRCRRHRRLAGRLHAPVPSAHGRPGATGPETVATPAGLPVVPAGLPVAPAGLPVAPPAARPVPARGPVLVDPLTDRELTVLRRLPSSLSVAEIARELYVSLNTVKTQIQSVYRKLGVNARHEAIERARRLGLL
jgi:LuxR family maltose regulon positive regulatory protein